MKVLITALSIGFPLAVILAWAFEITSEGIKRESEVLPNESITAHTGRKLIGITIALAVVAASLFAFRILQRQGAGTTHKLARTAVTDLPAIVEKSIAALAFENLSDDKSNAYFTEGVQEEILTRLSKIADLKVIARASTQKFKSARTICTT